MCRNRFYKRKTVSARAKTVSRAVGMIPTRAKIISTHRKTIPTRAETVFPEGETRQAYCFIVKNQLLMCKSLHSWYGKVYQQSFIFSMLLKKTQPRRR
jgi:hypothetical protein